VRVEEVVGEESQREGGAPWEVWVGGGGWGALGMGRPSLTLGLGGRPLFLGGPLGGGG
jgi:hypothetical protein